MKYIEICKIIYHTYFLTDLYNDDIYDLINNNNAEQLFNYIVYCNNNNIINNRIIKLTKIFINTNKKLLLKNIIYHYFNYANIAVLYTNFNNNESPNHKLFDTIVYNQKIKLYSSEHIPNENILILISNYIKCNINQYVHIYEEKYETIQKLINNEHCIANLLPLVTNDILRHVDNSVKTLEISDQIKNNTTYYDWLIKFYRINFLDIYRKFIIKKTDLNSNLYDLLMYIFYDKYILNYKTNNISENDKIYSISYIYLSTYWNFIQNKIVEENIFDTIEYKELYDDYKIISDKYSYVKNYLQSPNINLTTNLNTRYANCVYIQMKKYINIPFIYAYLPKVNFGLKV